MTTKSGKRSGRRSVNKYHQTIISDQLIDFNGTVLNCSINQTGMFGTYQKRRVRYVNGTCCTWVIEN